MACILLASQWHSLLSTRGDGRDLKAMTQAKQWDVAISFASADEPVASKLRDLLQPPHTVFVYSKVQEHLAGKDGVEAFRSAFREQATLVVILYAEPWGQTPWTRVE